MKPIVSKCRVRGRTKLNGQPAPSYLALVHDWPLRPLRSERDYASAVAKIDQLAVRPEGSLDAGE